MTIRAAETARATEGLASNRCGSWLGLLRMLVTLTSGPPICCAMSPVEVFGGKNGDGARGPRRRWRDQQNGDNEYGAMFCGSTPTKFADQLPK